MVFSRAEDSRYFLSPAWKLAEIQQLVRQYASPCASLRASLDGEVLKELEHNNLQTELDYLKYLYEKQVLHNLPG